MWAAQYFDFRSPRLWLTSGSMGTMGFGLPAAVGAQYAQRKRMVIDIDGDASIRMNIGELETVTTYDLPIKVVVLNNCGDGMVKQWQKLFHSGRLSASDKSLHTKDFVKAAQADGFKYAVRLDKKADVPRVIDEFIRFDGAAFLEVMIDPDAGVYPMVGPGQAYADMITGEHIPSRTQGRHQSAGRIGNVLIEPLRLRGSLPVADIGHGGPRLRRRQRRALLQQLDRNVVRRAHEGHAAVARRPVDGDSVIHQAPAGGVDIVHRIGQMSEIAAAGIGFADPNCG